jgi:hypothetical protein
VRIRSAGCLLGILLAASPKTRLEEKLADGYVFELWGMMETFAVLLGDPREPASVRHHWIGRPTPAARPACQTPRGPPLPPNTESEPQVRVCSVFAGYFDNAAANSGISARAAG